MSILYAEVLSLDFCNDVCTTLWVKSLQIEANAPICYIYLFFKLTSILERIDNTVNVFATSEGRLPNGPSGFLTEDNDFVMVCKLSSNCSFLVQLEQHSNVDNKGSPLPVFVLPCF